MTSITRSDDLRIGNRRAVLRAMRRNAPQSRTVLCEITGLSAATLSAVTSDLIDAGALLENTVTNPTSSNAKSRRGRPPVQLSLNPSAALVAAVMFTLNEVTVMLIDYAGDIVYQRTTMPNTLSLNRTAVSKHIVRAVDAALDQFDAKGHLEHIEIAFQGVTDNARSTLMWSPIIRHQGIPLKATMEMHFGVSVSVGNDCSMIVNALSQKLEQEFGGSFASLLLSHGIGMGILNNDTLISGATSSATEFGHMLHQRGGALCRCGRHGCIEAYAAEYAIYRRAHGISNKEQPIDNVDFSEIQLLIEQARKRNGRERKAFIDAGRAIGTGLGNLFALFDSFPVVLVGPITDAFDLMEKPIREGIQHGIRNASKTNVPIICFNDGQALVREGCAKAALDQIDQNCFVGKSVHHA